jgi:hypothetical protein
MTPSRSALARRAAAFTVTALALLALGGPVWSAPPATSASARPVAAKSTSSTKAATVPTLTVSLLTSTPTVPTGGTIEYTAQVRLARQASYLQTVFEVSRPSGQLLYKRTKVAYNAKRGFTRYDFERAMTDVLDLEPGTYPVRATATANVGGTSVTTETAGTLRVYEKGGTRVRTALVARVSGQPMAGPDGRFVVDPARSTGARNAVGIISQRILSDPNARVTLAVPPLLLAEWRRLSGGYTLADGTAVRPDDPVAVAYNSTLADLKAAIDTGRLELVTLGYADPNLTDLANHGLASDVGPQYDAGISAVFASLELTPSVGTAPAGGCVPPNEVGLLSEKNVDYVVVDEDCARQGKRHPDSGVYHVSGDSMHAMVAETTSSAGLSAGNPASAVERAFARLVKAPKEPLVMSVDIDGDSFTTTDAVGAALTAFEAQPWLQLVNARSLKPASGVGKVRLLAGRSTPKAPKGFWKSVAKSRNYAEAYFAALGASDPEATLAGQQSLVAESSAWAGPDHGWTGAKRGLGFADASLKTTAPILNGVSMKAEEITLSGSKGEIPITIDNKSQKTLNVVVRVASSGGARVRSDDEIQTELPPKETYLEIPVDLQASLSGNVVIEVVAGDLVLERETVTVRASTLDRLALGGMVVVVLIGMLVFIVRRTRAAQAPSDDSTRGARYTEDEDSDVHPSER